MANSTYWQAKSYFMLSEGWTEGEFIAFCNWLTSNQLDPSTRTQWYVAALEWRQR